MIQFNSTQFENDVIKVRAHSVSSFSVLLKERLSISYKFVHIKKNLLSSFNLKKIKHLS